MPQSLRAVNYKDGPSGRYVDRIALFNQYGRNNMKQLLSQLDPEIWGKIYDFDGIHRAISREVRTEEEWVQLRRLNSRIMQSIIIQNTQIEAKRWRERND